MPASTESINTKLSPRFSPFPSLSHPRNASLKTLETRKTSRLFSSEPFDGQGALCSQVTETQFFEQFGVDVSRVKSSPPATPLRRAPLASLDNLTAGSSPHPAPIEEDAESDFDLGDDYQSGTNSWALRPEEDEEDLSLAETWTVDRYRGESSSPSSNSDIEVKVETVKVETASQDVTDPPSKCVDLTPLERWIIERVREAREDGISAADGLRRLRNRCLEQERRELNLKMRELDLLRRLNEINHLSKNLD